MNVARKRRLTAAMGVAALGVGTLAGGVASGAVGRSAATTRQKAESALLRMDVAIDAYTGEFYSSSVPLSARQSAARALKGELKRTVSALAALHLPSGDTASRRNFTGTVAQYSGELDKLSSAPDTNTFNTDLSSLNGGQLATDENTLRVTLGLRRYQQEPWFNAHPAGKLVYRDSLARRIKTTNWRPSSPHAVYAHGGFVIDASAGKQTTHGPSSIYNMDTSHISVQVDARPVAGQPTYGIGCPRSPRSHSSQLIGVIAPGGSWVLGVDGMPGYDNPPGYSAVGGTSNAIRTTGTNRLRLDCEQFAHGLAIARLYVNGTYLGYLDAPLNLATANEASLLDISPATGASSTLFKNWSVSELAH